MAILKKEWKIFRDEMIKHGDATKAYQKAYPNSGPEAARTSAYKLLQNPTISKLIEQKAREIEQEAQKQAVNELKDEIKAQVLSVNQKREILLKIASGDIALPAKKPVWDRKEYKFVFVTVLERPSFTDRMKAIDIDNRMTGIYQEAEPDAMKIIVERVKK